MKGIARFIEDENGAVTVDWVVLSSALVILSVAVLVPISSGVTTLSEGIFGSLSSTADQLRAMSFSAGEDAIHFFDIGIAEFPNNQIDAWKSARLAVDALAPEGYEFDPNLTTTRYVDNETVYPIYVSDDGSNYSIGGEIIAASDYDSSGSSTFKSAFDAYWDASL